MYTNKYCAKKKIRDTFPPMKTLKQTKFLGLNLTKDVKDINYENFYYLKEDFEEETRKCRNCSCSRNGRIHIVKMIVLPNTIDQYSAILIKIPTPF